MVLAATLEEQLAIEEIAPGEYVSKTLPERMASFPAAYGGCAVGVAINAAYATVPPLYSVYSVVGHFIGPASTKEKLHCAVETTRNTRAFVSRRVQVAQIQPDGKKRVFLDLLTDFHVQEPALLRYSAPPLRAYSAPEQSVSFVKLRAAAVAEGKMNQTTSDFIGNSFGLFEKFFEGRQCPEGVFGQNTMGILKMAPTTQDHLPITSKTSGDWFRTVLPLPTPGERAAAIGFYLDGAVATLPMAHNHMGFEDVGTVSTLDFALRLFVPDITTDRWHFRERVTIAADHGRTYSEARVWDEKGTMVASLTQQCILRSKSGLKTVL
jgi:acyl-CoA thioesterase II